MFEGKLSAEPLRAAGGSPDRLQMLASGKPRAVRLELQQQWGGSRRRQSFNSTISLRESCRLEGRSNEVADHLSALFDAENDGLKASDRAIFALTRREGHRAGPMTQTRCASLGRSESTQRFLPSAVAAETRFERSSLIWKRRILDPLRHPSCNGECDVRRKFHKSVVADFITSRDWALVGEFVRCKGSWKGKQIIAAEHLADWFQGTESNQHRTNMVAQGKNLA